MLIHHAISVHNQLVQATSSRRMEPLTSFRCRILKQGAWHQSVCLKAQGHAGSTWSVQILRFCTGSPECELSYRTRPSSWISRAERLREKHHRKTTQRDFGANPRPGPVLGQEYPRRSGFLSKTPRICAGGSESLRIHDR